MEYGREKRHAFILIWLSGSLGLFLAHRASGITTKHISSFCRIAMASTLFLLVTWEHRDPPPALPWASVLWIKRVSQWTRDLRRLPSATSKWVTEIRGNAPQQRAHGFCCGAASGKGTGGRAALISDITAKSQSRSQLLLSNGLASCLCSITCCGESVARV